MDYVKPPAIIYSVGKQRADNQDAVEEISSEQEIVYDIPEIEPVRTAKEPDSLEDRVNAREAEREELKAQLNNASES